MLSLSQPAEELMRLTNKVIQESRPDPREFTKGKNENLTFKIGIKRETKIQRNSRIKT
jgi:hypothetical protein